MMHKTFCFDIDKTLCEGVSRVEDYPAAAPIKEMIAFVNELYTQGHTIFLYTGRHAQQALVTNEWLAKHGVKYHHLFLGKPVADVYIDDLAVRYTGPAETKAQLKELGFI